MPEEPTKTQDPTPAPVYATKEYRPGSGKSAPLWLTILLVVVGAAIVFVFLYYANR